jgi:Cofilin/tropomyosin-type actin-binding protein
LFHAPASTLSQLLLHTNLTACRLSVHPDCIEAFNDLKLGKNGTKYIIYKISDDLKEVVVDEVSKDTDYDVFREKLQNAKEKNGKSRPSYAVYDVAFDLDGGEGHRLEQRSDSDNGHGLTRNRKVITFITYIDQDNTSVKVSPLRFPESRSRTCTDL